MQLASLRALPTKGGGVAGKEKGAGMDISAQKLRGFTEEGPRFLPFRNALLSSCLIDSGRIRS
jgi:hypothetical protein